MEESLVKHLHFGEMAWPAPDAAMSQLEWTFRYGNPTVNDKMAAASVIAAYSALIMRKSQKQRNAICSEIRRGSASR